MRIKLDENPPAELAADLRELGHDVATVPEEGPAGRSDRVVLSAARRERRVLITLDKGVGAHLARPSARALPAIVLLRLRASGAKAVRTASIRAVDEITSTGSFTTAVVTDATIRLRR